MTRGRARCAGLSAGVSVRMVARLRRAALRLLCHHTRSLRRSLRQFTREIYICP